jgi:hypothetical protein
MKRRHQFECFIPKISSIIIFVERDRRIQKKRREYLFYSDILRSNNQTRQQACAVGKGGCTGGLFFVIDFEFPRLDFG